MIIPLELPIKWRSSKWYKHCNHWGAAALAHTQGCCIKKRNGKIVMARTCTPQSQLNQATGNRTVLKYAQKINLTSTLIFQSIFVIFPWCHDLEKSRPYQFVGCAQPHLLRVWRIWELLAFKNVKTSVNQKNVRKIIHTACVSRLTVGKII